MQLTAKLLHTTDAYIKSLEKSGVKTVYDMINHYPRDYEDRTNVLDSFSYINLKEKNTILVTLLTIDTTRTANNKLLTKAVFEDKNGFLAEGVWFNRQYFASQTKRFEGKKVLVSGKVKYDYGKLVFNSADVETDLSKVSGEIVPIYPDLNYIPGKWFTGKIALLKKYFADYAENLPDNIIKKYGFISKQEALQKIHFPQNKHDIEIAKARLSYEELYDINYASLSKKYEVFKTSEGKSPAIPLDAELVKEILSKFPFELTNHQKIALFQILKDMEKPHSMQRLLEWDVGTGKTAVAAIATIHSILQMRKTWISLQASFMAPTEILARQHFAWLQNLFFEFGISSELLVGSTTDKDKKRIKELLKTGNLDVIIGTHALIQEDVRFKNLGFVVVDEQHRFWVKQREVLERYYSSENRIKKREEQLWISFISNVSENDFKKIVEIIEKNVFNKLSIRREDYICVKKWDQIIGFVRIWDLWEGNFELSNLWLDESYRGEKLGYDIISYAYQYKFKEGNLYIACKRDLLWYYEKLGFQEVEKFPERFHDTLEWAREEGISYMVAKLTTREKLQSFVWIYPHSLNMTATPIPRTLALTLYGDQDLSIISEYPKGRKEIFTKVAKNDEERRQIELFVRSEIEKGRQVFWISPLVEESEKIDLANAVKTYESLVDIFSPFQVGLLHGRMKAKEKEEIMARFKANELQILSSTSVIEVWVDIPNASIMCIEGAERFGLSQLHQFRGRVGRGQYQSYCYLFPTSGQPTDRLRAMEKTNNGFELSEIDLEIRGPGEVYGVRQSGLPDLKIADMQDLELIVQIREDIEEGLKGKK
jgi:ATP-dependent DNA helicase RecG